MTAGACIDCSSTETRMVRGEDGHFRKECLESDCGHVGGPYVSSQGHQEQRESESDQQPGLEEFTP